MNNVSFTLGGMNQLCIAKSGWLKLCCNGLATTFNRRNYVPFVKTSDKQEINKR